jgi:lauroyl/myristoyl acyltransferase
MWLLHWLPLPVLATLGRGLGSLLWHAARSRRHVAMVNIRLCFPEWSEGQCLALGREHFQWLSRSILERIVRVCLRGRSDEWMQRVHGVLNNGVAVRLGWCEGLCASILGNRR